MVFYESTFIARQDVSNQEADKIADFFTKVIQDNKGEVIRKESWGLRNLAYKINKNRKGHYFMLCFSGGGDIVNELQRQYKLHQDVTRYLTLKVDKISKDPSYLATKKLREDTHHE